MGRALIRCLVTSLVATAGTEAIADVVIETQTARLVINDDATWKSLIAKGSGRECAAQGAGLAVAAVRQGGKTFDASSAALDGDTLTIGFAGTDTVLEYAVEQAPRWIAFRIQRIRGARPESVTLLRVPVGITANVGRRLNAAWDDATTVCLLAANRQVDCGAAGGAFATLAATSQDAPGPRLEGAAAALIVCPTSQFKAIAREASRAFGLLINEDRNGTPVKDTELPRGSYWFLGFSEAQVDKVIEYCDKTGFRQVMLSSGSWCTSPGHYLFNTTNYPDGRESLKRTVDKLHAHGILVGMHCFVSKVSKRDPYVTPIPDKRFWKDRETTLAAAVDAAQTEIRAAGDLREWPGSPVCSQKTWEGGIVKHQEVIIGDEIVQYASIGPEGKWDTFIGCTRGAWGTKASAHAAGATAYHYGVDGCINGYIIDHETTLMAEVADRIADIFNYCGFDMVYFDGGEDVDRRRFNYYAANFQTQAMQRFAKRPIVHMGTVRPHVLWHSFARVATVDTYLNTLHGAIISGASVDKWPTVKGHIARSIRAVQDARQDMMPGELGWFGIWPKGQNTDGLQLDEIEYLMCKSLAYDAAISLETSFAQMEAHPLTPEILNLVREYEQFRGHNTHFPPAPGQLASTRARREMSIVSPESQDVAMIQWAGEISFVPVDEVPLVGGTHDVRAFVGAFGDGSVATIWHYLREAQVLLDLDPKAVTLTSLTGEKLSFDIEGGKPLIAVGSTRNTLICRGVGAAELRKALQSAEVRARKPTMLFIRAADFQRLEGQMAVGSAVGVKEPEAFGDVLVWTGSASPSTPQPWYAEYTVGIPRDGRWTLWARVRYPTGADHSFGIVQPGEQVTLGGAQVLGNCGVNEKKWHWTGRGSGVTTVPPGQPITFNLKKGSFTFRIYAREGGGTVATNPRLDLLCLSDDPLAVPTDDEARQRLGR